VPFLSVLGHCSFAEDCYTTADDTWSCGTPTSSDYLTVSHKVVINGNFTTTAGIIIENNGSLEITGNFIGNDCNVIVKNEGTFVVNGDAQIESQCKLTVEGELKVLNSLYVKAQGFVKIRGTSEVRGSVMLSNDSQLKLKKASTLAISLYFSNNGNATEIDGDLDIKTGLVNVGTITGVGQISFNSCTSTGMINNLEPEDYCDSSPINLLESHCSSTDSESPIFVTFPADIIAYTSANNCEALAEWKFPEATDNCSMDDIIGTHNSGSVFQVGTTDVIYSATDKAGNETIQQFKIQVKDTISPVIKNAPGNITLEVAENECAAKASWVMPTATDNCSVTLTSDFESGASYPAGSTTVTYTASDPSGNVRLASFLIEVKNSIPPTFSDCPKDTILYSGQQNCDVAVFWNEPVATGCGVETTQSHQPGDIFTVGKHLINYTAIDASNNRTSCEFVVQVIDTVAPEFIFCPKEYQVKSIDTLMEKTIVSWESPQVSDNCAVLSLVSNHQPGNEFDLGVTEVRYLAEDENGNQASCAFNIELFINQPPVVESQKLFSDAGETLQICMNASDPDGDQIKLESIEYSRSETIITDVDSTDLCFFYTSSIDFDGIDTLSVVVVDNGHLPLHANAIVVIEVKGDRAIKVSSAITTNEDDINDKWIIDNITFYPNNAVQVFDPYGGVIYQSKGYDNKQVVWNGKNTVGEYVPTGTYFFAIDTGTDQKRITGAVEVIR